ncbi:MAG: hypothetical protein FWG27_08200 [Treponema sp.]|nr:hypothetical protein [Treponema sp.]
MNHSKKLCIGIALVMMAVFTANLYAQKADQSKNNQFSFGAACLVALSDDTVSVGPSLQFSWLNPRLFRNFIGLGVHAGLIVPIGEYSGYGATLIAGPAMTVFDNGLFRIPITLGAHADFVMFMEIADRWVWNIGAGTVADFVWHFGTKWYAYGRVQMACNFGEFEFLITPGLGMGFSW